ncbi:MAG: hypothetical protein KF809_03850 [Chloroflexi bacterium]|nr:hypothetical protein [Chloroflexota bacterium]
MRRPRILLSAMLASALAVTSGIAPFTVRAADTPEAAVNAVFDLVEGLQFETLAEDLAPLICERGREEMVGQFQSLDIGSQLFGNMPGVSAEDIAVVTNGFALKIEDRVITTLSSDATRALLEVSANMVITFSDDALRVVARLSLEQAGQAADDMMIEAVLSTLRTQLNLSQPMDATTLEAELVDGNWLLCEPLDPDASPAPASSADPAASPDAQALPPQ